MSIATLAKDHSYYNTSIWLGQPTHHVMGRLGTDWSAPTDTYWFEYLSLSDHGWHVTGNSNENRITGSWEEDILVGREGSDTLVGADDDDLLVGDVIDSASEGANDSLDGGAGWDGLYGGGGNDTLNGGDGWDTLVGNDGNDALIGGAGYDHVAGGKGNDTYHAGSTDTLYENANEGIDTVIVLDQNSYTLGANFENLVYGFTGNANLTGNSANNVIVGGAGHDVMRGAAGADTLEGGSGNDSMSGGAGDDNYMVQDAGDRVIENADGGIDTVRTTLSSYTLGANVENLAAFGAVGIHATGNELGNTMRGNALADALFGGGGVDALIGGAGNDTMWGEDGDDWVTGDAGADALRGGAGNDIALGGNDNDTLMGGDGNDALDGGAGADVMLGEAGRDSMQGSLGNDVMYGGSEADTMHGGDGEDRLRGDGGADLLFGNAGYDRFIYAALSDSNAAGRDTIQGFERGFDRIDLSMIDANANAAGNQAFWVPTPGTVFLSEGALTLTSTTLGTRVDGDVNFDGTADLSIMVQGVWGMTASDFIL